SLMNMVDGFMIKTTRPHLTVLCSVYNEEQTIPLFAERLYHIFDQIRSRYEPQLYFIDNGCQDRSYEIIRELRKEHPYTHVIVLSRNFGYQCALECGLRSTPGDLYVMIDVDCEDPPEMILEFLAEYERGYDIVYGDRVDRPEGFVMKSCRKLFYRL